MGHQSPIVYRYVDWTITVPLQMIEFNLILKAARKPVTPGMFWRLLLGTVAMLAFGYMGETGALEAWIGFIFGLCGWRVLPGSQGILQQHALHCDSGLVHLSSRIFLRLPAGHGGSDFLECAVQYRRFHQQDRLRAGLLVGCQE